MVGNASLLKDINRSLIINEIRKNAPISRADLIVTTGLTLPTVLRNINNLIEEGYIIEVGKGESLAGRKPVMLTINPNVARIIGISIGRKLEVILTDFNGILLDSIVDNETTDEDTLPRDLASLVFNMTSKLLQKHQLTTNDVAGIGIGMPGMNFKIGTSAVPQYFRTAWAGRNKDPYEYFIEQFRDFRCVLMEHVTICGALGEQWFGKTVDSRNNVYFTIETGMGCGIIINNQIYTGRDGFAGHIGHTVIDPDGVECYCGNRGCLETLTGIPYILDNCTVMLKSGKSSSLTSRMDGNIDTLTFQMVAEEAQNCDPLCVEVLSKAGEALGIGIANAINTLNPDKIVLGGTVPWSSSLFVEKAIASARNLVFSNKARDVEVTVSDTQFHSEARGAVALVLREMYKSPQL